MIPIKTKDEVKRMKEGGERLARVMDKVLARVEPGVKLNELDTLAESLIEKAGGKPSFKMVPNYHWTTCININQGVVHGIPNNYQVKAGDLVSLDMGMYYKKLHTDMARTIKVQSAKFKVQSENDKFLKTGEKVLKKAIQVAQAGNRVGHISRVIERGIEKAGFSPVRTLTGHGVGRELHEEPQIPCFLEGEIKNTAKLKPEMALAIEVIYTQGKPEVVVGSDDWTVETTDQSLAGLFEDTVLVTDRGPLVLTA